MRLALLLVSITLLLCTSMVSSAEVTYRVSGLVGQEGRWLIAVIEDSSGSCSIYSKGDKLGSWLIVDITPTGVLVDIDGETRLLRLEGSSFIARGEGAETNPGNSLPAASSTRPLMGKLSQQDLQSVVNNVVTELERDKNKKLEPQVLNAILGLPREAQITAVSDTPVKNPREALNMVHAALSNSKPFDFILSEDGVHTKIYFMPYQETVPHPHE